MTTNRVSFGLPPVISSRPIDDVDKAEPSPRLIRPRAMSAPGVLGPLVDLRIASRSAKATASLCAGGALAPVPTRATLSKSDFRRSKAPIPIRRNDKATSLKDFYEGVSESDRVLVVVGGGTAGLTYLSTMEIDPKYTHVAIVGDQGYWKVVGHRLAQPHHILALPHQDSLEYVDPSEHDKNNGILPHQSNSAYVHSKDYQVRLARLEQITLDSLQKSGKKVFIERGAVVQRISKEGLSYAFETDTSGERFLAAKIVVASGFAPGRALPKELLSTGSSPAQGEKSIETDHILSYTDMLTSDIAEKVRGKDVLVYGGGATAAWVVEVGQEIGKPVAWVARQGFDNAEAAGARVEAIINGSREIQAKGEIKSIEHLILSTGSGETKKIKVTVTQKNRNGSEETKTFLVDYLVNCIGQDPYQKGGLHDVLTPEVKDELAPILDRNQLSGRPETVLGFGTPTGNLEIIGAAASSYYDVDRKLQPGATVSEFLPKSGQAPGTVGGVVSAVSALTGYMPISQDPETGKVSILSLNLHVMNATQVAVYLTGCYQDATPAVINAAVQDYLAKRSQTEFGLTERELEEFMALHFEASNSTLSRWARLHRGYAPAA